MCLIVMFPRWFSKIVNLVYVRAQIDALRADSLF